MRTSIIAFIALLSIALEGCAASSTTEEETVATAAQDLYYVYKSPWSDLMGVTLNGRALNGSDLAGHTIVALPLAASHGNGRAVQVSLDGATLNAPGGLSGLTFDAMLDDGSTLPVRVARGGDENTRKAPTRGSVTKYVVSYRTDRGWAPYCGIDDKQQPIRAIALAGRWDYRQGVAGGGSHVDDASVFTLACEGYALAKCVDLGYLPWAQAWICETRDPRTCKAVTLAATHEACTRALRADYCGDGTSFTNDGTTIDVFDPFAIRDASPGWATEAEWTASGASCATRLRAPERGTPSCWADLQRNDCGALAHFDTGTALMSQLMP